MMTDKDKTRNYKPSLVGADTWTIMCSVETYSFERKLSVDDAKSKILREHLHLRCNVRSPDEIAGSFVEITIWQSDELIVVDDLDKDYVGVGVFRSLDNETSSEPAFAQFMPNQQGNFYLVAPADLGTLQEFGDVLLRTQGNPDFKREFHAEIAGLFNEWNGNGNLCVASLSLVVSGREQQSELNEPRT